MKTKNFLSVVILLTVSISVLGQEQLKTIKRISIHDIFIQTGFHSIRDTDGSLADFEALASNSILLHSNLTDFYPSGGFTVTGNNMFSIMLGVQFIDKQKITYRASPLLRLGISYYSGTNLTGSLYKEDRKPYDTLTSSQTGHTYYVDSVTTENYNMDYISEQLRFDGSLIFRTNPAAHWTLFVGIGLTAGLSINASTEIYYSIFDRIETRFPDGNMYSVYNYSSMDNGKTEKYRNKSNLGASTFIPMGIDFRIGKKSEFWKQIHLFYELRPGIIITSIPELRTITNVNIQHGFGIRLSWD